MTWQNQTMILGGGEPLFNMWVPNTPDFHYGGVVRFDMAEAVAYLIELMAIDLVYNVIQDERVYIPWEVRQ